MTADSNAHQVHPWQPIDMAGLALLALGGALLRLIWLEHGTYAFDQASVSHLALAMARGGRWASTGMQSSLGVPNPPLFVWVLEVLYRISPDPLVATTAIALMNALSVPLLGWVAHPAWGRAAGLTAALLWATSPWAILFSRTIWAQNLLPPLAVLWALCAAMASERKHPAWTVGAIALAGLAPQIHYAGLALSLPTLWLLWRQRLWKRPALPALGAAVALLPLAPFARVVWRMRHTIWAQLADAGGGGLAADLVPWQQLAHMGIGAHWEVLAAGQRLAWPGFVRLLQDASVAVLGLWLAASAALVLVTAWRMRRTGQRGALLELSLVWAISAPLLFTLRSTVVYHHYLLAALPALPLLAAFMAGRAARTRTGRAILSIALLAACLQGGLWAYTTTWLARHTPPPADALLWPRQITRALDPGQSVIVYTDCTDPVTCNDAAVWSSLLYGRPYRITDGRHVLIVPNRANTPRAQMIVTPPVARLWDAALGLQLFGAEELDMLPVPDQAPYRAASLTAGWDALPPHWTPAEPLTLESGAQLRGWRVQWLDGGLRFWTLWQAAGKIPTGQQVQQFTHLYVGQDKVAGADGSVSLNAWQPADWLFVYADLELPPDAAPEQALYVEIGMYRWPELERLAILEQPESATRAIRLGPLPSD